MPKNVAAPVWAQAFSEGAHLGAYSFNELKSDKKEEETAVIHIGDGASKAVAAGFATGETLAECINFSRRLGDMPGNLMTPEIFAAEVEKAAKGTGLKVTVWDKARIKKERMGCLIGVSLGSAVDPRFIILEYNGGGKSKKPVCFVGKGLTFDSGGISIKPAGGMEEMKYDMCGGANTVGTLLAIAKLKLKVNAIGYVPSSENMPGPLANKPGDITVARNGKSVEVNNTDAEGRLILADALSYATEQKPAFIVDTATLTGAMVIALGDLHTGFFSKNEKISKALEAAAAKTGERLWRMPLVDEHREDMKGTYADLNNISSNKGAGSAHGAAFLECFVDLDIPWAHVDIAGTSNHTGHRLPYNPKKGASGCMIRTYVELAKSWG
jgi:leucyl aminopeptidase